MKRSAGRFLLLLFVVACTAFLVRKAHAVEVVLEWTASPSPDVYSYSVYRTCSNFPPWSGMVASMHGDRATDPVPLSFEDDLMPAGQTCSYSVSTIVVGGNESAPTTDVLAVTMPPNGPDVPAATVR